MPESSPIRMQFAKLGRLKVEGNFRGGDLSSDGGLVLLRETDRRLWLLERAAQTFTDWRDPRYVKHSVPEMLSQLVYGICADYEDLSDHDRLRGDPMLALAAGRADGSPLASPATLCRLENSTPQGAAADRYRRIAASFQGLDELLVDVFLESCAEPPDRICLDLDATDIELHGRQELGFWHGYYDCRCYLPLYLFCGEHLLLCRLRPASIAPGTDALSEIVPVMERIRRAWPATRILLRGDSGFSRDPIMAWCEDNGIDFLFGLARNPRLERTIAPHSHRARWLSVLTGKPERIYSAFMHQTLDETWRRPRRVAAKAEHLPGRDGRRPKSNARFVVTSLTPQDADPGTLYALEYCPRGNCERYIAEQLDLGADRASASAFAANQLRLYLSGLAYVLVSGLRRLGIDDPEAMAARSAAGEDPVPRPDPETIRARYLKVAARITRSTRRWLLEFAASYPCQEEFAAILDRLRAGDPVRARAPAG